MDKEQIAQVYQYDRQCFNGRRRYEEHLALEIPEAVYSMEDELEHKLYFLDVIEDKELYSILKELKSKELQMLKWYAIDGLSVTEIANLQKKSKSTISEKVHRILKKIKKIYKNPNKSRF